MPHAEQVDDLRARKLAAAERMEREHNQVLTQPPTLAEVSGLAAEVLDLRTERERLRSRLYVQRRAAGSDHTTACSIWGDDGQGGTEERFAEPLPCNCGALENHAMRQMRELAAKTYADIQRHLETHRTMLSSPLHDACNYLQDVIGGKTR